jgi:hypothetical protein
VCGSEAPGELLDTFVTTTIGNAMGQLSTLGLESIVPEKCNALSGRAPNKGIHDNMNVY